MKMKPFANIPFSPMPGYPASLTNNTKRKGGKI